MMKNPGWTQKDGFYFYNDGTVYANADSNIDSVVKAISMPGIKNISIACTLNNFGSVQGVMNVCPGINIELEMSEEDVLDDIVHEVNSMDIRYLLIRNAFGRKTNWRGLRPEKTALFVGAEELESVSDYLANVKGAVESVYIYAEKPNHTLSAFIGAAKETTPYQCNPIAYGDLYATRFFMDGFEVEAIEEYKGLRLGGRFIPYIVIDETGNLRAREHGVLL